LSSGPPASILGLTEHTDVIGGVEAEMVLDEWPTSEEVVPTIGDNYIVAILNQPRSDDLILNPT